MSMSILNPSIPPGPVISTRTSCLEVVGSSNVVDVVVEVEVVLCGNSSGVALDNGHLVTRQL